MPRLSVIAGGFILAMLALASVTAQARVMVRSINDLRTDPKVAALEQRFILHASASVLFAKCTQYYGTTQDQLDYHTATYAQVRKDYATAYYEAYVAKVEAPPPQKIVDYYLQYITTEEQSSIAQTTALVQQRGCQKSELQKLYSTVEAERQADIAAKNKNKKRDPWAQPTGSVAPVTPPVPAPAVAPAGAPVAAPATATPTN